MCNGRTLTRPGAVFPDLAHPKYSLVSTDTNGGCVVYGRFASRSIRFCVLGNVLMASAAIHSGLHLYLRQINESPLLNAQEEEDLARRIINDNDPAARERMVRSNLRLVVNIAKHY